MKLTLRGQPFCATVAGDLTVSPKLDFGQPVCGDKKADLEIARRQQRHDRPARRHGFARPVIDLLDRCRRRAVGAAARQAASATSPDWPSPGAARPRRRRKFFCVPAADFSNSLRAIEALLRIDDSGCCLTTTSALLQIVVDREQQIAFLHVIALAHLEHLDAALLVRRDENQFGLDPALQHVVVAVVAAGERQRRQHHGQQAASFIFMVLSSARTATRHGPSSSCGRRAARNARTVHSKQSRPGRARR